MYAMHTYINTHTSGHSLGAAGVHEAIYSLLMMDRGFVAKSANIHVSACAHKYANS
jgi:3-oxoacyl-(acyl-carrier-protein) synthase